jgi:hypothetical protein
MYAKNNFHIKEAPKKNLYIACVPISTANKSTKAKDFSFEEKKSEIGYLSRPSIRLNWKKRQFFHIPPSYLNKRNKNKKLM